ncbi:MAG TPA: methionyl-tRNA formyltransferase [Coriobacteriia bacterium]
MRVVFMGTPSFAVPSLEALLRDHEVVAVYTRPDAAKGRGRRLTASPVKERAIRDGIRVEQPRNLRDPEYADVLRSLRPDAIVVAAYGVILPSEIIELPRLGCFNVHASLLPRWRGAAPIQRAILADDVETGVSIMRMEAGLDTGPWCIQAATPVGAKTTAQLTDELAELGATVLLAALELLARDGCEWVAQDEALVTYAAKVTAADVALAPELTVGEALRRVRASGPTAPSRMCIAGRSFVVVSATVSDLRPALAGVATDAGLTLGLADGALRLDVIVPEGRSAMPSEAYLRGARLSADESWSAV